MQFAKEEWQEGLSAFSDEVVKIAVNACRDFYEMPPTLSQMITCCNKVKKRMASDAENKSSCDTPRCSPDSWIFHMSQIKQMLNK